MDDLRNFSEISKPTTVFRLKHPVSQRYKKGGIAHSKAVARSLDSAFPTVQAEALDDTEDSDDSVISKDAFNFDKLVSMRQQGAGASQGTRDLLEDTRQELLKLNQTVHSLESVLSDLMACNKLSHQENQHLAGEISSMNQTISDLQRRVVDVELKSSSPSPPWSPKSWRRKKKALTAPEKLLKSVIGSFDNEPVLNQRVAVLRSSQDQRPRSWSSPEDFKEIKEKRRTLYHQGAGILTPATKPEGLTVNGGLARETSRPWKVERRHSRIPSIPCIQVGCWEEYTQWDEYIYRQLLQCVLNPLGNADQRPGYRPYELANYLKQIFNVSTEDHSRWVKELQNNKPGHVVLSVTVAEARDLKPMDSNGLSDPYCILSVIQPNKKSPSGSPRHSPRMDRRRSSYEYSEVKRTQIKRETLNPKWNETFEIDVHDITSEELQIYIWDSDEGATVLDSMKHLQASGLKSLFRQIKHTVEFGKATDDFIGQIRIPLRNIPAAGSDEWYDLYTDKKFKVKTMGQCRLTLALSVKQDYEEPDSAESDLCSIEDYYRIVKQVYHHAIKQVIDESEHTGSMVLQIPEPSKVILHQFSVQNHINKLTQTLMQMVVSLEIAIDRTNPVSVPDQLIKEFIVELETEYYLQQTTHGGLYRGMQKLLLTNTELELFDRAATDYIHHTIESHTDLPQLFPPNEMKWDYLNTKVNMMVKILNLHLWSDNEKSRQDLSFLLTQRLQDDVKKWITEKVSSIRHTGDAKDPIIPEMKIFTEILQQACTHVTPIFSISQEFDRRGIQYYKIVSQYMESRLAKKAQEMMAQLEAYQIRYQKYSVNVHESSKVSMNFYFALRSLYNMVQGNVSQKEQQHLALAGYQSWFTSTVTFWLQTFKHETNKRLDKALEIEKDIVTVTSLVKHSNSSVDVLSCFAKVTEEWKYIGFEDPDIALMGVTKITDLICDSSRHYADKAASILKKRGYYDVAGSTQFDVPDQLCITLNNIEHVRTYLVELPVTLQWEEVCRKMSEKHKDLNIGSMSLSTLTRLSSNADADMLMKSRMVQKEVTSKMAIDMKKLVHNLSTCEVSDRASIVVDPLMTYLDDNLKRLHDSLEETIFPSILEEIWEALLSAIKDALPTGREPEYYTQLLSSVRYLKKYFQDIGVKETRRSSYLMQDIRQQLEMNAMSSEELMLTYLKCLALDGLATPVDYYGHLAIKMGYVEETGGNITLIFKVLSGKGLPAALKTGTSNPMVSISLLPHSLFTLKKPLTSQVIQNTLDPDFDELFQCPCIPREFVNIEGASVVFTVWHFDSLLPNEFLGEVVLQLKNVNPINIYQSVDDVPAIIMPLKRPTEPSSGPFQVLKDRSEWCKMSFYYVQQRSIMAGFKPALPLCAGLREVLFRLKGRKEVTLDQNTKNSKNKAFF